MASLANWSWRSYLPKSISCWRDYGFGALRADLLAGMTVAVVALPLAMAFAIASGVGPAQGLYTAIIGGAAVSLLSGSRFQIGGPTGAFVVIVFGVIQRHGYDGLALATLMAGVILLLISVSGLGGLIRYIPYPVTTGFTSGIALIIFCSQIKDFFGLSMAHSPAEFLPRWVEYVRSAHTINGWSVAVGGGALAALIFLRRWAPRLPGALIVVVAAALAVWLLDLPVETIGSRFGEIPSMLPAPRLPAISLASIQLLLPDAFTIAALAAIESLLSAVVADGMTGDRHRPNAELLGQGVANIASVLFGGIAVTGAIARTATNIRSGAHGPLAGVVHAAGLLAFMVVAAPLAKAIPLTSLAAVLMIVAWNMGEVDRFVHLFRAPRADAAVLLITFALTVLVDLNVAIQAGLMLAALLFMKRMIEVGSLGPAGWLDHEEMEPALLARRLEMAEVEVYEIAGPFFFGVADRLKGVLDGLRRRPAVLILRMRHVPAMDATGLYALRHCWERCRKSGTTLILSGVQAQPARTLRRAAMDELIGRDNICRDINEVLDRARTLLTAGSCGKADEPGGGLVAAEGEPL